MNYGVLDKIRFLSKAFTTVAAAVRFLPRVDPYVRVHVSNLREPSATETTRVRFLSRVRVHVSLQIGALDEAFATNAAAVGLLSCVCLHVARQNGFNLEVLVANAAGVRFVCCLAGLFWFLPVNTRLKSSTVSPFIITDFAHLTVSGRLWCTTAFFTRL